MGLDIREMDRRIGGVGGEFVTATPISSPISRYFITDIGCSTANIGWKWAPTGPESKK